MARKDPLLSSQISILFDAIDGGEVPAKDKLMSSLMKMLPAAQSLESGQAIAQTEGQVTALEKEIKDLQAMHGTELQKMTSENAELESLLEQSNAEVKRLKEEERERQKQQKQEYLSTAERRILNHIDRWGREDSGGIDRLFNNRDVGMHSILRELGERGYLECHGSTPLGDSIYVLGKKAKDWLSKNPPEQFDY